MPTWFYNRLPEHSVKNVEMRFPSKARAKEPSKGSGQDEPTAPLRTPTLCLPAQGGRLDGLGETMEGRPFPIAGIRAAAQEVLELQIKALEGLVTLNLPGVDDGIPSIQQKGPINKFVTLVAIHFWICRHKIPEIIVVP